MKRTTTSKESQPSTSSGSTRSKEKDPFKKVVPTKNAQNLFLGTAVCIILITVGFLYVKFINPQALANNNQNNENTFIDRDPATLQSIKNGLFRQSLWNKFNQQCSDKTVAVGYNTNLDLIVDATDLLEALKLSPSKSSVSPSQTINNLDQFEKTFSYYFKSGSAAERFVQDESTFKEIIDKALSLPKKTFFTGGNAGIMANRLAKENCNVYLNGVIGSQLKQMLDPKVKVLPYETKEKQDYDEIHLIMEYGQKNQWGDNKSPRANRFIVSNDVTNSNLLTMESFHKHLDILSEKPDLILLSGLHLLNQNTQKQRIHDMMDLLKKIPYSSDASEFLTPAKNIPVHLELASIASENFIRMLANSVIPYVDSLGLNEQEIGFLYTATGGDKYTMDDFKQPTVNVAVEAITHIFNRIVQAEDTAQMGLDLMSQWRTTTRIHFHYLTYHIVAIRKNSAWSSEKASASVAASSIEATNQACAFDSVELHLPLEFKVDYRYTPGSTKTITINKSSPVTKWQDSGIEFHIAPVLVCQSPSKTVGLGDSISTIGFLYQTVKF
ncbi:hypothetical protein CYY_004352 [Polysphondylium violaceum]|uniref:ADP-dependent glucokinase n=1 Tax=Polysphondylium violaceum TaxID=133409 RepID=A0A8J4PVI8_9MYCE|nr:hypothetical protein CYY_004352 [Polysphondylium violaceum]